MAKIIMFTSNSCPNCVELKNFYEAKGIDFEEINTSTPDGLAQAMLYDVLATPTILIKKDDGQDLVIRDFEEMKEVEKYL